MAPGKSRPRLELGHHQHGEPGDLVLAWRCHHWAVLEGVARLQASSGARGCSNRPILTLFPPNFLSRQSGGVSIPAMKVVNPASRLKQGQQGSPDKGKHIKQRMEYMRIQGQQQVLHP